MALQFIGTNTVPNYVALAADIVDSMITGATNVGATVLTTDDSAWYIIEKDLTLSAYALPIAFSGTIALGEVSIDQSVPGTSNGVEIGTSAAVVDGIGNYGAVIKAAGDVNSSPILSLPLVFNGASWDRPRTPNIFKDISAVAITTIATIWTPASGKKFRLMGGSISVSGACSVLFEDNSAGTTILRTPQLLVNTPYSFELGNGILSGAINRVLKATASTGTVALTGHVYGVEE